MLSEKEVEFLRSNIRPIVHLRRQFERHRLGLVFGAGIGKDIGLPDWDQLVRRIAEHPEILAPADLPAVTGVDQSLAIRIQRLFEWFREKRKEEINPSAQRYAQKKLIADWREIIAECLYEGVNEYTPEGVSKNHPYLPHFVEIIEKSDITINYNFDQSIQLVMEFTPDPKAKQKDKRRVKTISKGSLRARSVYPVIYHPNGYLPKNLIESTDHMVFTEESFADQLLQISRQREDLLLSHFSNNTCLLIGLSLNDPSLKHLLRQAATANPGHCHYIVCFDKDGYADDIKTSISAANFQVYNLVTLFLDQEGIANLARFVTMSDTDFNLNTTQNGIDAKFVYYVTGPMGVGKSTSLSHFYSLLTFDEWSRERLPLLARDSKTLSKEEEQEVDTWLSDEFFAKNYRISQSEYGIHLVDRPPLDPISFKSDLYWYQRASELLSAIGGKGGGKKGMTRIESGHVIVLQGDPAELRARIVAQNKLSTEDTLREIQIRISEIYVGSGITTIDTRNMSASEVVKRIAWLVYIDEYVEADLHDRLTDISNQGQRTLF